jgi:hypothetical protein
MPDDSMRTVVVALGAGIGVTLAKVGAAVFTGSTALAAEAAPGRTGPIDPPSGSAPGVSYEPSGFRGPGRHVLSTALTGNRTR